MSTKLKIKEEIKPTMYHPRKFCQGIPKYFVPFSHSHIFATFTATGSIIRSCETRIKGVKNITKMGEGKNAWLIKNAVLKEIYFKITQANEISIGYTPRRFIFMKNEWFRL